MAKFTYKGKDYDIKIKRAFALRMEEAGFPISDAEELLKKRPIGMLSSAIKCALETEDSIDEVFESYEDFESLSAAGSGIIKEWAQGLRPTQAAAPKAAKKR